MAECAAAWATPLLGPAEPPDPSLAAAYAALFPAYLDARRALPPIWHRLADARAAALAGTPPDEELRRA
jgi:erythritol kinase